MMIRRVCSALFIAEATLAIIVLSVAVISTASTDMTVLLVPLVLTGVAAAASNVARIIALGLDRNAVAGSGQTLQVVLGTSCLACTLLDAIMWILSSVLVGGGLWPRVFAGMVLADCTVGIAFFSLKLSRLPAAPRAHMDASQRRMWLVDNTLRTFSENDGGGSESIDLGQCVICLTQNFDIGEAVTALRCKHLFHSKCIEAWILRGSAGCPMRCQPMQENGVYMCEWVPNAEATAHVALPAPQSTSPYAAVASLPVLLGRGEISKATSESFADQV